METESTREELENLAEAFTLNHLVFKWSWDTGTQQLINKEPLLETLEAVKLKMRAAVGSGNGAVTQGSRVALSLSAVDLEIEIRKVTGQAGYSGSLAQRVWSYATGASPINEDMRASQLARWAYQIDSLVTRRTAQLELQGSCPSCSQSHCVYSKPGNAKGYGVCLVVVTDIDQQTSTAYCRGCGAEWSRGQLNELANALV